ncbi:hypothetical protein [Paracoccus sp. ME4]|uniref:hypothetical protein n=1 Tax=Paracoccus sp. ME4 TaxID=3138066 RepID=UPI00398A91D5
MAGYERCVTTFIDIMGFKALLARKKPDEIARDLSRFRKFAQGDEPGEIRVMTDFTLQSRVHAEIVSDAIVRVRTTDTDYRDGALHWELLDLLHIQIQCIDAGIILRGALKIGDMHVGDRFCGPIFGPALADAYLMEENEVVYPMIAVAEDSLMEQMRNPALWREGNSQRDEVRQIERLLKEDDRGILFLDYLRAAYGEIGRRSADWIQFMERHRDLIIRELQAEHPDPVRVKYEWLRRYHNDTVSTAPQDFPGADAHDDAQGDILKSPEWSWLEDVRSGLLVPEEI